MVWGLCWWCKTYSNSSRAKLCASPARLTLLEFIYATIHSMHPQPGPQRPAKQNYICEVMGEGWSFAFTLIPRTGVQGHTNFLHRTHMGCLTWTMHTLYVWCMRPVGRPQWCMDWLPTATLFCWRRLQQEQQQHVAHPGRQCRANG